MTLNDVFWVGGSTCAGKTSVARRLAERYELTLYHRDEREPKRAEDVDGDRFPNFARWAAMSLDERWAVSSAGDLVADTLALGPEMLEMTLDDVRTERRPLLVEGFQIFPDLLAVHLPSPHHAVFLVATPAFRRSTHLARPHASATPSRTSDPERAQRNRVERDDRVGEHILSGASRHGLKAIKIDGSRRVDDIASEVEEWLEPALQRGS